MSDVNVAELLLKELGAHTTHQINSEVSTIGVAVTRVLRQRPFRIACLLINLSTATIYLAPDPLVSSARGICLTPGGGNLALLWKEDYQLVAEEWYALATAAASPVLIVEVLMLKDPGRT